LEKSTNQITFNFAEEGPGYGSEDIKTEWNVNFQVHGSVHQR
jgi:hypothetical protein